MAMKIRLARGGSKKRPFYRIVAADSRMPRDGRYIERLGTYNPLLPKDSEERVKMNIERIQYWISEGAQVTDRVSRFLEAAGILDKTKRQQPRKHQLKRPQLRKHQLKRPQQTKRQQLRKHQLKRPQQTKRQQPRKLKAKHVNFPTIATGNIW